MLNNPRNILALFIIITFINNIFPLEIPAQTVNPGTITINAAQPVKIFDPRKDLGAGIDGHDFGEVNKLLSNENIKAMRSVGFKPLTYRLRTELANEAWHWNPHGSWSDVKDRQGYWTSDTNLNGNISLCYGYRLPRRGNTIDQANNDGYSRLDDGDPNTFWKSNPYLDKHFTGEDNALHEQWIVIDLGEEKNINAVKILWGTPFAVKYEIQYGKVDDISDVSQNPPGMWNTFQYGEIETQRGGEIQTKLADSLIKTRYLRVLLKQSSGTAPKNSKDIRDQLGFAVREIYAGNLDADKNFQDAVRHLRTNKQTKMYVSSTDPWHRITDMDRNTEHIGFDRVYKSGLTNDSPLLIPVGLLYDTPENAAAEITYLTKKGYKLERVEMGEEPDGQYVTAEDYGALYVQFADAIHRVAPNLELGGPGFQEISNDVRKGRVELFNPVWFERFINYLNKRNRAADFSFFSFEWYPFDDVCEETAPQLAEMPEMLDRFINAFRRHGLKPDVPLVITEYGYSAFAAQAEVDIEGALLNADAVGKFLTMGGSGAYLYGYEPNQIEKEEPCTAGNNMLFLRDPNGKIRFKTATYFGANLMMQEWLQPTGGAHRLYNSISDIKNEDGQSLITAYAVQRPDKKWALMLINKDPQNIRSVKVKFTNAENNQTSFTGNINLYQFSGAQYKWDAKLARPVKDNPPQHKVIQANQITQYQLPPYSLTILRKD